MKPNQDQREILSLTKKLIQFQTTPDRPAEMIGCMNYIEKYFKSLNARYKVGLKIIKLVHNKKPSLIVTFKNTKTPKLFLNGHIDVVHGNPAQFRPQLKGDKLIGRGAADMKAGVAIIMRLFKELCKKGDRPNIGAMIVSDEETGSFDTTKILAKKGFMPEFFITTESSDESIGYAAKGVLTAKIRVRGKPCHSSMPWLGKDPVDEFLSDYQKLRKTIKNPTRPAFKQTMCLTVIKAGDSSNRVPAELFAVLNIRTTSSSEQKKTFRLIKKVMRKHKIEFVLESGVENTIKNIHIQKLAKEYQAITLKKISFSKDHGASDARFFSNKGMPAVTFGPLGRDLHGNNEWVSIKSSERVYKTLRRVVEKF